MHFDNWVVINQTISNVFPKVDKTVTGKSVKQTENTWLLRYIQHCYLKYLLLSNWIYVNICVQVDNRGQLPRFSLQTSDRELINWYFLLQCQYFLRGSDVSGTSSPVAFLEATDSSSFSKISIAKTMCWVCNKPFQSRAHIPVTSCPRQCKRS